MRRFFNERITDGEVVVCGQEAKHMARVLRMDTGDSLILFDGSGIDYAGRITKITEDGVHIAIIEKIESKSEPPVHIHICQAVIKSDHLDYVVQKCSEMGAYDFMPFISERCVKRPDEKSAAKLVQRERRIALEAAKQCGRSRVPAIGEIVRFKEFAAKLEETDALIVLAYENEKNLMIKDVLQQEKKTRDIFVVIGPEGGFTKQEVGSLIHAGAKVCSLGALILRSETAGLAATAMIQYHLMETRV